MIYGCLPSRYEYTNFVVFFFFKFAIFSNEETSSFPSEKYLLNVIAMRDENSLSHSSHLYDSIEFAFLIIFGYSCRCYVLTFRLSSLYSYILSKIEKKMLLLVLFFALVCSHCSKFYLFICVSFYIFNFNIYSL